MIIKTPVSLGELVDKLSILHIKNRNIKDEEKLKLVREEMNMLNKSLDNSIKREDVQEYLDSLIEINSKLWVIEDNIRDCERNNNFDQSYYFFHNHVYYLL